MLAVEREARDEEARALFDLTAELADNELAPNAAAAERDGVFPREAFRLIGRSGLLSLPYPGEYGGGEQPYETYLQVVEELAGAWLTIGLGVSVHVLSCFPLIDSGTAEQRERWLPGMLSGDLLGAYCLSEPASGSNAGAMRTNAKSDGSVFVLDGTKAWISHGGQADYYAVFARTSGDPDSRETVPWHQLLPRAGDDAGRDGGQP